MEDEHKPERKTEQAPIVYVKGVRAEDLPEGIEIPAGISTLYAIHGENGEQPDQGGAAGRADRGLEHPHA